MRMPRASRQSWEMNPERSGTTSARVAELQLSPLAALVSPPPLDQLIAAELLADERHILPARRTQLRAQRDHLAGLLQEEPHWSFRSPPGGLSLWLRLHRLTGQELAHRAQAHGLLVAPGQWFSPNGTLVHHVRLPFTATPDTLTRAVAILRSGSG